MTLFDHDQKFPCPCCGYRVYAQAPGNHEICPICAWEDDLAQLRFAAMPGSANPVALIEAQKNFSRYGAAARRVQSTARQPVPGEIRDAQWRQLDVLRDNIEEPCRGLDYADSYPNDPTVLYYWRPTYWRRHVS